MAQNEPQRKKTPLGPSPNSPSLLFEYQRRSGKFIRLANRIESKLFCPYWNALLLRLLRITVRNQRIRRSTVDTSTDDSWAPFGGSLLIDFLVVSRAKHFLINYFWCHRRRTKKQDSGARALHGDEYRAFFSLPRTCNPSQKITIAESAPTLITNSNLNTVSVLNNLLTTDTIHKRKSSPTISPWALIIL